jgi:hypothetical protein
VRGLILVQPLHREAEIASLPLSHGASAMRRWKLRESPGDPSGRAATMTLTMKRGYQILVKNRKEPWGQTVSRVLADGVLVGVAVTPSMREERAD